MKNLIKAELRTSTGVPFSATGKKRVHKTLVSWSHGEAIISMALEEVGSFPDLALSLASNQKFDARFNDE